MSTQDVRRKLAAILSANAVGSSPLMEDDKKANVKTFTACRGAMTSLIRDHSIGIQDVKG